MLHVHVRACACHVAMRHMQGHMQVHTLCKGGSEFELQLCALVACEPDICSLDFTKFLDFSHNPTELRMQHVSHGPV